MRALPCFSLLIALFDISLEQYQPPQQQQQRVNNQIGTRQSLERVICTGCQPMNGNVRYSYSVQQGYGQQPGQQQNQQNGQQQNSQLQSQQYNQQRVVQTYSQQGTNQLQYGSGQMSLYNQQQQQLQRTGTNANVVNTPVKLDTYTSSVVNGAQVQIRLTSYQNANMALSNTTTCNCPISYCDYLPQNQQNACSFSFVTVISSAYQSVQYMQSDFNPFYGSISTGNWTNPQTFQMVTKPVAIDIFVQHLGVMIDKVTGNLLYFGRLTLVDSFVVDLSKFKGGTGGDQSLSLVGTQLGTQLQLTLNIQCINGMMGDMCDMTCSTTQAVSSNYVVCTNNRTGDYFNCTYNSYNAQVSQCVLCVPSGTAFNGTCIVPIQEVYTGVSTAFRIWTIVLGCLLGVAVLLILCLIISYIIVRNRDRYEDQTSAYKNTSTVYRNGTAASRPLIEEDEWTKVARRPATISEREGATATTVAASTTGTAGYGGTAGLGGTAGAAGTVVSSGFSHKRQQFAYESKFVTHGARDISEDDSFTRNGGVVTTTTTVSRQEHQV